MKSKKEIENLFEQIEAASDSAAAAEEKLNANDKIIRSFFGLSAASEKELADAVDQQRSFGEPIEFIEDAIKAKAAATKSNDAAESKRERLLAEVATLVDAEAKPLIEAMSAQLCEIGEQIKMAMEPFFDTGAISTATQTSHVYMAASQKLSSLQSHNTLMPRWAAVQRVHAELNKKEK